MKSEEESIRLKASNRMSKIIRGVLMKSQSMNILLRLEELGLFWGK